MPANTSGLTLCRALAQGREKRPIDPVRFASRHPEASSTIGASFCDTIIFAEMP